jgi:hypothetical protein
VKAGTRSRRVRPQGLAADLRKIVAVVNYFTVDRIDGDLCSD